MKEQERYFFAPQSLTGHKKQTRQNINFADTVFETKVLKVGAMLVSSSTSLPTAQELNIASHVLLQSGRYFQGIYLFSLN